MPKDPKHKITKNSQDGYAGQGVIKNPTRSLNVNLPFEKEYDRILKREQQEYYSGDNSVFSIGFNKNPMQKQGAVIDNNEYINMPFFAAAPSDNTHVKSEDNISKNDDSPNIGEYILMVSGKIVLVGNLSSIEDKAKNIVYGDDNEYQSATIDDMIILKRVSLKIGVFIEE